MKNRASYNALDDWKRRRHLTYQQVAELCRAHGWKTSASYLTLIICGHHQPSWEKAKLLSAITGGEVKPAEIMEAYELRHSPKKKVNELHDAL